MLERRYLVLYNQILAERHLTFIGAKQAKKRLAKEKGWNLDKIAIAEDLICEQKQ